MFFLAGVLSVIIIGILVIGFTTWAKNRNNVPDNETVITPADTQEQWSAKKDSSQEMTSEKWQEGTIDYKGKKYMYNEQLKVYLLMGVDRSGKAEASTDYTKGGQSDAMFLLVADEENHKMSIVSINRNTMVEINTCDSKGNSLGKYKAQICVQHGFGDGRKLSCTRTVEVVEKLFYNIPISGYIAINMDAVPQINNVVGGVKVKAIEDIGDIHKGQELTLSDQQAFEYLRGRNQEEHGSADKRLRRQEQFIKAFIRQVKNSSGITQTKIESIYDRIEEYMVTSVDFTRLVSALIEYDFEDDNMYTVPGETVRGKEFEEYNVDQDAFYDLVINVFYREVGGN